MLQAASAGTSLECLPKHKRFFDGARVLIIDEQSQKFAIRTIGNVTYAACLTGRPRQREQ